MEKYNSILVVKMSSLGDIIHTLPSLAVIRENWPHAKIVWAVQEQFKDVLPGKPWIDDIISIDKDKLTTVSYLLALRKKLRRHQFDIAIDFQGLSKSAIVMLLSGAKKRVTYGGAREGSNYISKVVTRPNTKTHVIERGFDIIKGIGGVVSSIQFPLADFKDARRDLKSRLAAEGLAISKYVVMAPGTRWEPKDWPVENYAEIGNRLVAKGFQVVLLGSNADIQKGHEIQTIMKGQAINMIGKTNLQEMIAFISGCTFFMSGDTGPLHIASAMQLPLIALYGPTSPERFGPYNNKKAHVIVSPTSKVSLEEIKINDTETIKDITVDRVWEEILTLKVCEK